MDLRGYLALLLFVCNYYCKHYMYVNNINDNIILIYYYLH